MKRILVVDDDSDTLNIVKRGLAGYGYSVDTEKDARAAIRNFRSGKYDLVILDFKMPLINGFEIYQKIRDVDTNVKVCFLTAWQDELDANLKSLLTNGHLVVTKPVSISDLEGKIHHFLD